MNENCEIIRQAAMSLADGEPVAIPEETIRAHLAACAECRRETEALQSLSSLMSQQTRRGETAQLWPLVASRLASQQARRSESAGFFVALAAVLLICQAALFFVTPSASLLVKAAMVLFVAGLLVLRGLNPFVIETELAHSRKGSV